jgi:hypothetical protein
VLLTSDTAGLEYLTRHFRSHAQDTSGNLLVGILTVQGHECYFSYAGYVYASRPSLLLFTQTEQVDGTIIDFAKTTAVGSIGSESGTSY